MTDFYSVSGRELIFAWRNSNQAMRGGTGLEARSRSADIDRNRDSPKISPELH